MDMDATIKGADLSVEMAENIIAEILSVKIGDGVTFRVKRISEIMDESEYPGVRISMESDFDGVCTPIKIDISTGDIITPQEVTYRFRLMFEQREISVMAYNLETVLAEKLETIIARDTTNTRMRDFYDIYILTSLHGDSLNTSDLQQALRATAERRASLSLLMDAAAIFKDIEQSDEMKKLWSNYQRTFSYAEDISWQQVMAHVRKLWQIAK